MFECELNLLALEKHVICDAEAKYSMGKMKKDVVTTPRSHICNKTASIQSKQHRHQIKEIIISTCIKLYTVLNVGYIVVSP